MRILITGGAGFIGSHLADALVERGHKVIVFDDFSTGGRVNLAKHKNEVISIEGNILDRKHLAESLKGVEYCFHFAAAVGVEKILKDPIGSLKTNIHGSENVLELCCEIGIPVILASTSEIYGKNSTGLLNEESDRIVGSPLLSRWTYSDAKALDEAFAVALANQKGLKIKIIRFFNTVGPRQSAAYGMVIPSFFEAAMSQLPLVIHGDGSQQRIFCHISDAVAGTLALWESEHGFGEAFNLGGTEETSILNLAKRILEITGSNSEITYLPYEELRKRGFEDMQRRLPDSSKLRKLTSWEPRKNLNDILFDYYQSITKK